MRDTKNFAGMSDPAACNAQFSRRWQEESSDSEGLQVIGKVAHKVMVNTAVQAVEHWLQQAGALKDKDRMVCLETADAILCMAGLTWGDKFPPSIFAVGST